MSINLIEELSQINALSGHERPVREFLEKELNEYVDEIKYDNLGGLVTKINGDKEGKNIAVVAHMDEVGMLVKNITNDGFIKIANVGGLVVDTLICQHVQLINRKGEIFDGSILGVAPHNAKGDKPSLEDLFVDFGFENKESALKAGIRVGDQIIMKSDFTRLADHKLMGKAFDNRLGCAAIIEIAKEFSGKLKSGNLYLCASVQEEVGLRGASVIMNVIQEPIDYVLVIDVSPVDDTINRDGCKLSAGTLIRVKDPRMILDYDEIGVLQELSEINNIKAQEFFSNGGTDAAQIQIQNTGYVVSALCVPGRNLHSNNSIIDYRDYEATRDLAVKYIKSKQIKE